MKKILLLLSVFFALGCNAQKNEVEKVQAGDKMPAFTIQSNKGKLESSDLEGKVVLINFFATWCPPCQKELAKIQEDLWPKYKDNAGFVLLVIGREHTDVELEKYNEKKGFDFPLYPDVSKVIYEKFATQYIPRTYLIGKNGEILYASTGYTDAEFKLLMEKIEAALK